MIEALANVGYQSDPGERKARKEHPSDLDCDNPGNDLDRKISRHADETSTCLRTPTPESFRLVDVENVVGRLLAERLRSERVLVAAQLEETLAEQLRQHRTAMAADISSMLGRRELPPACIEDPASSRGVRHAPPAEEQCGLQCADTAGQAAAPEQSAARPSQLLQGVLPACPLSAEGDDYSANQMSRQVTVDSKTSVREWKTHRLQELHRDFSQEGMADDGKGTVRRWVSSTRFEVASLMVIMMNAVLMAVEVQYQGVGIGYELGVDGYSVDKDVAVPWAATAILVASTGFTAIFVVELLLRIEAMGLSAVTSRWIWLDGTLAILALVGTLDDFGVPGVNFNNASAVRLLRFLRLSRLLRSAHRIDAMQSLYLLIKSITASVFALAWAILILIVIMNLAGLSINQMLVSYLNDPSADIDGKQAVFEYFGTYSNMMVTMFELTLGNWVVPARVLMRHVNQHWGVFVVIYRCIFCFAVVNVIRAVFITETQRVAASDDEVAILRKSKCATEYASKLKDLFDELDVNGDGFVSRQEFNELWSNELMIKLLGTLDLEASDVEKLHTMFDDGGGEVAFEAFLRGMLAMKGSAKGIDIVLLSGAVKRIEMKVETLLSQGSH